VLIDAARAKRDALARGVAANMLLPEL